MKITTKRETNQQLQLMAYARRTWGRYQTMSREQSEISQDKKELKQDKKDLKRDAKLLRAVEQRYGADSPEAAQLRKRVEASQAEVNASQGELERDRTQRANLKNIKKLERVERKLEKKYDRMVQRHGKNSKDAMDVQ
jgi:hypothetical protein